MNIYSYSKNSKIYEKIKYLHNIIYFYLNNKLDIYLWYRQKNLFFYWTLNLKSFFYSLWNFVFDQPFLETIPWYGIVFTINEQKVDFDLIEFKRNPKTYKIDCENYK